MAFDGTTLNGELKFIDLDITIGSIKNLSISALIIPNNSLTKNKIVILNTCLISLSDNKQDNITLNAGGGISISQSPTNTWTITNLCDGLLYGNTDNYIDNLNVTMN